ncbi:MAG: amidase [Deltaproteobacteria bacterium]|nr:amidase [Deltaproteobacteria bacterium]MBT6616393.1 amidase [Deltaproteobacteria bacterium]MBT7154964.1 amidase [Deltaproteobacteria bacterium]MBT7715320.1 amidase [Deltaproteobacteria bacterium]
MTSFKEYRSYDAVGLAGLVRKGEVEPSELLETAIEHAEKINPQLNAIVNQMYDLARESISKGLPNGPLRGVPFLLKDLGANYSGVSTTRGSRLFQDAIPDYDSELVKRYKNAGLVIFGKTNTPEFGLTITTEPALFGPCRNPWNTERSTGGSSGGAAAAVASGIVPVAHASDGGGSIRIPASCCGLFGLKPTRARVSPGPFKGESWNGMSISHVVSRSVGDSAAFLDSVASPALGDPYWAPHQERPFLDEVGKDPGLLKIAFSTITPTGKKADADCTAAVEQTANLCETLGHDLISDRPQIDADELAWATLTIIQVDIWSEVETRLRTLNRGLMPDDLEHVTATVAGRGRDIPASEFLQALHTIHRLGRQVAGFFDDYDILLSPVLLTPPILLGTLDMSSRDTTTYATNLSNYFGFTNLFNVTGQPSMSVPLYWTANDLPVGLQFTAKFGHEALLFRLAAQLEQAQPWRDRRPPLGWD